MKPATLVIFCAWLTSPLLGYPNVHVNLGGVPANGTRDSASKRKEPYEFSVAAGLLRDGLSVGSGGTLTIRINLTPFDITTTSPLPAGIYGIPYSQTLTASGGAPPHHWSGSAPAGLTLSTAGVISGVPSASGTFNFPASVTDSSSQTRTRNFAINIDVPALTITTGSLPGGLIGTAYGQQLLTTGGVLPLSWSISSGLLPAGLALDAGSGYLSGVPGVAGSSTFTAQVKDSRGTVASKQLTIAISKNFLISTGSPLPNPVLGTTYTSAFSADGGVPPYNWTVASGSLPDGLTLDAGTGRLSGNPSGTGQFSFVIRVSDSVGASAAMPFSLTVVTPALPALSIASIPDVASAAQQLSVDLNLASSYPLPITGQVTMDFVPDPDVGSDDPAVQFSTGGRSVSFTIAPNSTQPTSPIALQTGSVAGTIELQVTAAGSELSRSIKIERSAPTIRDLTLVRNATGFALRVVGLSPSRELTSATVRFTGARILTSEVTIPLSTVAGGWYASKESAPFGSQFSLMLPFTVQGDSSAIQSATLIVSNPDGASATLSVEFSSQ